MRVKHIIELLSSSSCVVVYDREEGTFLGQYDGKTTIAKCLLNNEITLIDTNSKNEISLYINFNIVDTMKCFSSKCIAVVSHYINHCNKSEIEFEMADSEVGTLVIVKSLKNGNYAHSLGSFYKEFILQDIDYLEYVTKNLDLYELELEEVERNEI